jgi:hypothetical protein
MGELGAFLGSPGAAAVRSMIQAANKLAKGVVAAIISIIILVLGPCAACCQTAE